MGDQLMGTLKEEIWVTWACNTMENILRQKGNKWIKAFVIAFCQEVGLNHSEGRGSLNEVAQT